MKVHEVIVLVEALDPGGTYALVARETSDTTSQSFSLC
jgi:hypothetical protein